MMLSCVGRVSRASKASWARKTSEQVLNASAQQRSFQSGRQARGLTNTARMLGAQRWRQVLVGGSSPSAGTSPRVKRLLLLVTILLAGCTVGVTVTNAPDTLPCAPGKGINCQ